ncbi:hypothetical protein Pan161_61740 [Gimesia algae]|uniref:Uncharacterized protein n=1 Tax=Gimesia algae TaxID=2527971 RepID=A0A517VN89_9PLAN|nr:hypothetical protein Pan161_61740 [Gimesia algae]
MAWMMVCIPMASDLREGHDAVNRFQKQTGWRTVLMGTRYEAVLKRCRDEVLRSVATRRHTWRTGAVSGSEDLEKTGCIVVKIENNWRVFQCSVNWARARPKTALIAGGAQWSSSMFAGTEYEQCSSESWFSDGLPIRLNPNHPSDVAVNVDTGCSNQAVCKLHLLPDYPIMKTRLISSAAYPITTPPASTHLPTGLL